MTIAITYTAIPNANASAPGWLPSVTINGKAHGSTYAGTSYSEADALSWAKALAEWWATKYVGDWNITINAGEIEAA